MQIKMSFASGSIDLSETCGVPEYSVSFIESPIRLKVEVFDLAYWDYVINSAPVDNSLLITGMFYNIIENSTTFYFNLSKAELAEMEMTLDGGLSNYLEELSQSKDNKRIVEIFKEMILKTYGVKSPDGRRFIKNKELSDEFAQTEAFSELFMELALDEKAAADFFSGILPASVE